MGASLAIKLFTETEFFEAQASVIYSHPDQGMGLMFREQTLLPHGAKEMAALAAMMGKKGLQS